MTSSPETQTGAGVPDGWQRLCRFRLSKQSPLLVGGANAQFIGNVIYSNLGTANNLPFAATLALVPIVIMAFYLLGARALGAFESL